VRAAVAAAASGGGHATTLFRLGAAAVRRGRGTAMTTLHLSLFHACKVVTPLGENTGHVERGFVHSLAPTGGMQLPHTRAKNCHK